VLRHCKRACGRAPVAALLARAFLKQLRKIGSSGRPLMAPSSSPCADRRLCAPCPPSRIQTPGHRTPCVSADGIPVGRGYEHFDHVLRLHAKVNPAKEFVVADISFLRGKGGRLAVPPARNIRA
jgi:hypothetical protein